MAKKKPATTKSVPAAKHTAGPWKAIFGRSDRHEMSKIVKADKNPYLPEPMLIGYVIREIGDGCPQQSEDEANARLIAAAPELLADAEELYEFLLTTNMDPFHPRMLALASSIKKAKGE